MFAYMQSADVETGAQITLKTEEVISMLVKAYMDLYMGPVVNHVDALSKQVKKSTSYIRIN